MSNTHVNLVDFIDHPEAGVQTFPSEVALSEYTIRESKYFPKDEVHAGSLLKHLLRNILRPSPTRVGRGTHGRSEGPGGRGRGRV